MADSQENVLGDMESWRKEAGAVINDIQCGVREVSISEHLDGSSHRIYVNVTTLENDQWCIELTMRGFRVVGRSYDSTNEPEDTYYETPYSLLGSKSPLFQQAFANALLKKLNDAKQAEEAEDDDLNSVD